MQGLFEDVFGRFWSNFFPPPPAAAPKKMNATHLLFSFSPASTYLASKTKTTNDQGFRAHEDKLDGYSFLYPDDWIPGTTSGNDVFFRSPLDVDTNLFVDVSSPSSSKYETVADLGTPREAAEKTLKQYLTELMSTRIGVRRSGEVLSASARELTDEELSRYDGGNTSQGAETSRLYYDVVVRMRSVASRNQLAVSKAEVDAGDELEWERDFRAVLGVAGKRLYEFRLQSPTVGSQASASSPAAGRVDPAVLDAITRSFRCREVQA